MSERRHDDGPEWLPISPLAVSGLSMATGLLLFTTVGTNGLLLFLLVLLSGLYGLVLAVDRWRKHPEQFPSAVTQLLKLARDSEFADVHHRLAEALSQTAERTDPIFRGLASQRLEGLVDQANLLAAGTIEYSSTESWRVAYEELLRSPGLHLYRSIAHIESAHYWQDGPGQQSTRLNLELQDSRTIGIERIATIADHLWPEHSQFPVEPIHDWLDEQHRHGIWLRVVRESLLLKEPELLSDLGIYGSRAVGLQLADPAGRTQRFVLSFDFDKVRHAEDIWNRLVVYSAAYRDLLDQKH